MASAAAEGAAGSGGGTRRQRRPAGCGQCRLSAGPMELASGCKQRSEAAEARGAAEGTYAAMLASQLSGPRQEAARRRQTEQWVKDEPVMWRKAQGASG